MQSYHVRDWLYNVLQLSVSKNEFLYVTNVVQIVKNGSGLMFRCIWLNIPEIFNLEIQVESLSSIEVIWQMC